MPRGLLDEKRCIEDFNRRFQQTDKVVGLMSESLDEYKRKMHVIHASDVLVPRINLTPSMSLMLEGHTQGYFVIPGGRALSY